MINRIAAMLAMGAGTGAFPAPASAESPAFAVERRDGALAITRNGRPVADYVFRDARIPRPYFARLHAPDGTPVTRSHPPVPGTDPMDHDTIHPGLWLAFGDLNGVDFWRNRGRIEHVRFAAEPAADSGRLSFAAEERYLAPGGKKEVCRGTSAFRFVEGASFQPPLPGTVLFLRVELRPQGEPLTFGPQHEMGLGVRVATPLLAKGGGGSIVGSHGGRNEAGNWGRAGTWWDYAGAVGGRHAGILLLADAGNPRPVWAHARDYGFLALNPTGPPAKPIDSEPSVPFTVPPDETLSMKFAVLMHAQPASEPWDAAAAARAAAAALAAWTP